MGALSDSIQLWVHINPHLIFYIFLPALIFGSAFSVGEQAGYARCAQGIGPPAVADTLEGGRGVTSLRARPLPLFKQPDHPLSSVPATSTPSAAQTRMSSCGSSPR